MIKEIDGSIFDNLTEQSVILNQCNTKGWVGNGVHQRIHTKYPESYKDYREYCQWFKDGHEQEILGTWARTRISDNLIICNAITQMSMPRNLHKINYDAWHMILKKLEQQTRYVNKTYGTNWIIHVPNKIEGNLKEDEYELLYDVFRQYFEDSPVTVIFHRY